VPSVRVSRRELLLLSRYTLVQADLPLGYVIAGGRLISAAESWMGTGLVWLRSNVEALRNARPERIDVAPDGPAASVDAHGESIVMAGIVALDLVTIAARGFGSGSVTVRDASGVGLAPALTYLAAPRGLATVVTVVDGDAQATWTAAGSPDRPFVPLTMSGQPPDSGTVRISALADGPPPTRPRVPSVPDGTSDGLAVDMDTWTQLLDMVGGTLPPDGRGRLTIADDDLLDDAGPGAGVLHDDD
jgi:hypothetical protein